MGREDAILSSLGTKRPAEIICTPLLLSTSAKLSMARELSKLRTIAIVAFDKITSSAVNVGDICSPGGPSRKHDLEALFDVFDQKMRIHASHSLNTD
jgi:hypothetical protein